VRGIRYLLLLGVSGVGLKAMGMGGDTRLGETRPLSEIAWQSRGPTVPVRESEFQSAFTRSYFDFLPPVLFFVSGFLSSLVLSGCPCNNRSILERLITVPYGIIQPADNSRESSRLGNARGMVWGVNLRLAPFKIRFIVSRGCTATTLLFVPIPW